MTDLSQCTNEQLLEKLKQAALADVVGLTCTKEQALRVMTDEVVEKNAALFAAKPVVGLQEFIDAQDTPAGKYAAYLATTQDGALIVTAAFAALLAADATADLTGFVRLYMIYRALGGQTEACILVVGAVCEELEIITNEKSREDNRAAADEFFQSCMRQAVAWALAGEAGLAIAGDATPGIVH